VQGGIVAAQRLQPGEKLVELRAAEGIDGYEVHIQRADGSAAFARLSDVPPGEHTELLPHEHGEVRVNTLVEKLFRRLRARKP
jgi:hypothetical protein